MDKREPMQLWDLQEKEQAQVVSFKSNLTPAERCRLEDLGLRIGGRVECLKYIPWRGPRLYRIQDSIFSIAQDIAQAVEVCAVRSS